MLPNTNNPHVAEMDERIAQIMARKTVAERFQMANEANQTARARIAGFLKTQHPQWTVAEVQAEVARRMLDGTA